MAAQTLTIATASLPDLELTSITPPVNLQAGQFNVSASWNVTNDGNGTANGSWNDHVVLSTDPAGKQHVLIFSGNFAYAGGPLLEGSSYTGSITFNVPSQVGVYYLTVTTNSGSNVIPEITPSNDTLVSVLNVGTAYYATLQVQANEKHVPAGHPRSPFQRVLATDVDGGDSSGGSGRSISPCTVTASRWSSRRPHLHERQWHI